jgi:hypothetical protein
MSDATEVAAVIESETHRQGATRRTSGVWRRGPLTVARWDDWSLRDDDLRHAGLDAARHLRDDDSVAPDDRRLITIVRSALAIRRRARQGASAATIAGELGLSETVVAAVLTSPLTRALTILEERDDTQ